MEHLPIFIETLEDVKEIKPDVELVSFSNPILRTPMEKFNFVNPPIAPTELYKIVGKAMIDFNGVGLSSCQIGLPYHFFVLRTEPVMGMFNAEIVDASKEKEAYVEGCLSFPGLTLNIKRAKIIKVRYTDPLGERKTAKFQDMTARIIQHELDHCNGIPFGKRVTRFQLERALKKSGKSYLISDVT